MGERRIAELEADSAYLGTSYKSFAAASRQESVREVLRDYYRRYRAELAALSEQAAANGEAIPIRAPELATALVALFEGLTLLWMMEPEGVNASGDGADSGWASAELHLWLEGFTMLWNRFRIVSNEADAALPHMLPTLPAAGRAHPRASGQPPSL